MSVPHRGDHKERSLTLFISHHRLHAPHAQPATRVPLEESQTKWRVPRQRKNVAEEDHGERNPLLLVDRQTIKTRTFSLVLLWQMLT